MNRRRFLQVAAALAASPIALVKIAERRPLPVAPHFSPPKSIERRPRLVHARDPFVGIEYAETSWAPSMVYQIIERERQNVAIALQLSPLKVRPL